MNTGENVEVGECLFEGYIIWCGTSERVPVCVSIHLLEDQKNQRITQGKSRKSMHELGPSLSEHDS